MNYKSESPQQTYRLAEKIGRVIPPGTTLALVGDLGAGKTVFAQGLAAGLSVAEQVTSPTFIFFQQYQGRCPFYHIDAYRLSGDEGYEVGLEECFSRDCVTLVEWPQNIAELLPDDCLEVQIERGYDGEREWRDFYFPVRPGQYPWLEEIIC